MTSETLALFDRLAAGYDETVPFFASFGEQLVDWLAPAPGTRVLDLGCGRGALAIAAAARGCHVTAIDGAPAMVAGLAADRPDLTVRVMDAQRLEFPDASFDLVVSGFVVHLLPDPDAAMAEVRRVLAPGGRLAFSWPSVVYGGAERWEFLGELNREFLPYVQGRPRMGNDDEREGDELLAGHGFTGIGSLAAEVHLPLRDVDQYWDWASSHGSRQFTDALPADRRAEYQERLLAGVAELDPLTLDRGAEFWLGTKGF